MGKRIIDGNQESNGINQTTGTEGTEGTNGTNGTDGTDTSSSSTTATPRGSGRGRGRGTTEGKQDQESSKILLVEEPQKSPEQLAKEERRRQQKRDSDARRRERLKAEKEGKVKPVKKSNAQKSSPATSLNAGQLNILVLTLSNIVASREGMGHWQLSPQEVDQIMTPLSNILSKYEGVGDTMSQYADHIALTMALGTIIIPRAIVSFQMSKAKKEGGSNIDKLRTRPSEPRGVVESKTEVRSSEQSTTKQPASVSTNVSGLLSEIVPAIGLV
jgi:hypothetical protein